MRVLLDTHVLLWWAFDDPRLAARAAGIMRKASNDVVLSSVVVWEIGLKASLGKLAFPTGAELRLRIEELYLVHGFQPLPIHSRHAVELSILPWRHRDPFDRMLVAQSRMEGIPILTNDPAIAGYDVQTIW